MSVRRSLVVAMLGAVVTISGCGLFDGDDSNSKSIAEALSLLPDLPDEQSTIFISDYARIAEINGTERPASDASDSDATDYIGSVLGAPNDEKAGAVAGDWFSGRDAQAFRQELGFSILDVDLMLETGPGPGFMRIVEGRLEADAVSEAASEDPAWSDLLDEVEHEGHTYLSWGESNEPDSGGATPARPLGIGGRFWVENGRGVWAHETSTMESVIEAVATDGAKLVDEGSYLEVAEALDAVGAHNAILVRGPAAAGLLEGAEADILAVGEAMVGESFHDLLVVSTPNERTASQVAAGLEDTLTKGESIRTESPWADLLTDCEVGSEGRIVIVDCVIEDRPIFREALFSQDLPVLP